MKFLVDRVSPDLKIWIVEDAKANSYATIKDIGYTFKIVTEDNVKATFATIDACMEWFMREGDTYELF